MKTCSKCNLSKEITEFYKTQPYCTACKKIFLKEWKAKNRQKVLDYAKDYNEKYYQENKEEIKTQTKVYYESNKVEVSKRNSLYKKRTKKKRNTRDKHRKQTDINFRLRGNLRSRLWASIRNGAKVGSAIEDLGCSIDELKQHLEAKFQEDMNWTNWGNKEGQWSIDHIVPLSSFDLANREEFLKACHYTNLQPLWHVDNLIKSNKTA